MALPASDAKSDPILLCPVCHETLRRLERILACDRGHQFDVAKEGYVNLLRLKKRPKFLGDSKEMFHARRTFLEGGYYDPLVEKIAEMIQHHAMVAKPNPAQRSYRILDAGCGEGYYMRSIAERLDAGHSDNSPETALGSALFFGMDIAKDGPRLAAKRMPNGCFFVADINQPLLFPDNAVDIILNIFSPRNAAEFARLLSMKGQLIVVIPNANHLNELRSCFELLEIQADKENHIVEQMAAAALTLTKSEPIFFPMQLSPSALRSLLHMTPNHRHLTGIDKAGVNKAGANQAEEVEKIIRALDNPYHATASFQVLKFQHASDSDTS